MSQKHVKRFSKHMTGLVHLDTSG